MHRILDLPEQGGLGLRRCQWHTTTLNEPSKKAALRLGYTFEGVMRAQKALVPGKVGRAGESGWRVELMIRGPKGNVQGGPHSARQLVGVGDI